MTVKHREPGENDEHDAKGGVFRESYRFGLASGLSALITLGIPVVLHELISVDEEISVAIAMAIALIVNFFVTRNFVFRSQRAVIPGMASFFVSSVVFRLLEFGAFVLLFRTLQLNYLLVLVSILTVSFVVKFFYHRFYTFGDSHQKETVTHDDFSV